LSGAFNETAPSKDSGNVAIASILPIADVFNRDSEWQSDRISAY
jgi:hypothetical protein